MARAKGESIDVGRGAVYSKSMGDSFVREAMMAVVDVCRVWLLCGMMSDEEASRKRGFALSRATVSGS